MKPVKKTPVFLVGAAIAGLLVGSTTLAACSGDHGASAKEKNGCNGPNGCGSAGDGGKDKKEKNGCNGPNGCAQDQGAGATRKGKG